MGPKPKPRPRPGREEQSTENRKRQRSGTSAKEAPSRSGQFKKAKHPPTVSIKAPPRDDDPAEEGSSKLDESSILPSTDPASIPAPLGGDLATTYDITSINVLSSTQIEKKVTQTLGLLSEYPTVPPARPKVVRLHAKAPVASKMITIAEIAKREIAKGGGKWFQYNMVEEVIMERKEAAPAKSSNEKENQDCNGDDGDDDGGTTAFETMKTPFERENEGKPKVRAVPIMTLHLSRVRIESLRKSYGEQTNALGAR